MIAIYHFSFSHGPQNITMNPTPTLQLHHGVHTIADTRLPGARLQACEQSARGCRAHLLLARSQQNVCSSESIDRKTNLRRDPEMDPAAFLVGDIRR